MTRKEAEAFSELLADMIRTMESPSWTVGDLRNAALDHLAVPRYPKCKAKEDWASGPARLRALFTQVRGRGILRSSPKRRSQKFVSAFESISAVGDPLKPSGVAYILQP